MRYLVDQCNDVWHASWKNWQCFLSCWIGIRAHICEILCVSAHMSVNFLCLCKRRITPIHTTPQAFWNYAGYDLIPCVRIFGVGVGGHGDWFWQVLGCGVVGQGVELGGWCLGILGLGSIQWLLGCKKWMDHLVALHDCVSYQISIELCCWHNNWYGTMLSWHLILNIACHECMSKSKQQDHENWRWNLRELVWEWVVVGEILWIWWFWCKWCYGEGGLEGFGFW